MPVVTLPVARPKPGRVPKVPSVYLGIDPGTNGGMAALWGDLVQTEAVSLKGMSRRDILNWLEPYAHYDCKAVIEKNSGYVGDGGNPGSGMFTFGISYGQLLMACEALAIPCEEETAAVWQKNLSIRPKVKGKETKTAFKNRLKDTASQMFRDKDVKVTLNTADALLLAVYCYRRTSGGEA